MTLVAPDPAVAPSSTVPRSARLRRYLMCPPTFFAVSYEINPWMDLDTPVDPGLAMAQWSELRATYERLGHRVEILDPVAGLPDLVFAANAGLVVDGRALVSRFHHGERRGEEVVDLAWFHGNGFEPVQAEWANEGEGDLLVTDEAVLAGSGFRTDPRAHAEVAAFARRPVVPLELVDPRWYHLDTALAVLDGGTIAYYPGAFADASRRVLADRFPDALIATERDALAFGLNACSDGRHVVLAAGAVDLIGQLVTRGYEPIPIDTSELQKSGGSVKCCTLELRP